MARKNEMTQEELRTEIQNLYNEFYNEVCPEIAAECEAEGYPSGGVNHDLRCTAAWERFFGPEIDYLTAILETGKAPEEDHGKWVKLDLPEEFADFAPDAED